MTYTDQNKNVWTLTEYKRYKLWVAENSDKSKNLKARSLLAIKTDIERLITDSSIEITPKNPIKAVKPKKRYKSTISINIVSDSPISIAQLLKAIKVLQNKSIVNTKVNLNKLLK